MKIQALADPDYVGPEIKGKARSVRQRFGAAAAADARKTDRFETYLYDRALGDRMPGLETVEEHLTAIDSVGQFGRISMRAQLSKREYNYSSTRVLLTTLSNPDWPDGNEEPGIAVVTHSVILERTKHFTTGMKSGNMNLVVASQHTLERCYQRSFTATDEALMEDLIQLTAAVVRRKPAEPDDAVVEDFQPEAFRFGTDNGTWRGMLEPMLDYRDRLSLTLNVRTFI